MGKKGGKHHQKRLATPITFPMERKGYKFTFHGIAGAGPIQSGIPLGLIIRDMLKHASNLKELKYILNHGNIYVDGKSRRDPRFIVGPMDIISIPSINMFYRFVPWIGRRKMKLVEIEKEDSMWKLVSIRSKTTVRGGHIQLNLENGRNILLLKDKIDSDNALTDPMTFKTRGTLKIELPSQNILDYYPFELNHYSLIVRGTNTGLTGMLQYIEKRIGKNKSIAIVEGDERRIITAMENVFIIGKETTDLPHYKVGDSEISSMEA